MNKEFNDNNYQTGGHHEGQQNNISAQRADGVNNPPEIEQNNVSGQQPNNKRQEGEEGRLDQYENTGGETESDRANRNEDEGTRGGNSSI